MASRSDCRDSHGYYQKKGSGKLVVENELRFRDLTQNVPGVIYQWIERLMEVLGLSMSA